MSSVYDYVLLKAQNNQRKQLNIFQLLRHCIFLCCQTLMQPISQDNDLKYLEENKTTWKITSKRDEIIILEFNRS